MKIYPKIQIALACLMILYAQNIGDAAPFQNTSQKAKAAAFSFSNVKYFHRYTIGNQHEYTPAGQENLKAWTDMVTINIYPKAKDGKALAATANSVLTNYKANKGSILKTASVPKTATRPAEHLIVVVFGRPEFIEVAFARFKMQGGAGRALIYSHRVYGQKFGDAMSAWLKKNGPTTEKNLMSWNPTVSLPK